MRDIYSETLRKLVSKQQRIISEAIDLKSYPKDIIDTLSDEYGKYYEPKFDWNSKADEFTGRNSEFREWIDKNNAEGLVKNIDTVIQKVRQDLILKIKKENADKVLEDFEDLIKPTLGDSVLCEPLSEFMEDALVNLHSVKEIEKAFKEAKNIIDPDGL